MFVYHDKTTGFTE
jgi:hypothetical protein